MVGKHVFGFFRAWDSLSSYFRLGAIGTDYAKAACAGGKSQTIIGTNREMHPADAVIVAGEFVEYTALAHSPVRFGTHAQPFVKLIAVDHANKTAFDRNIDFFVLGRYHAGRTRLSDQQLIRNLEVLDQARRYGAAARFDAPLAVKQQHAVPLQSQIIRSSCTCRSAAHYHHVIGIVFHHLTPNKRTASLKFVML